MGNDILNFLNTSSHPAVTGSPYTGSGTTITQSFCGSQLPSGFESSSFCIINGTASANCNYVLMVHGPRCAPCTTPPRLLGADAVGMGRVRRRVSKWGYAPAQGRGRERGENGAGQGFPRGRAGGVWRFFFPKQPAGSIAAAWSVAAAAPRPQEPALAAEGVRTRAGAARPAGSAFPLAAPARSRAPARARRIRTGRRSRV